MSLPPYNPNYNSVWTSYKFSYTASAPTTFGSGLDESKLPRVSSKEPIVGYRVWKLNKETSELMSCYKTTPWPFRKKLVRGTKPPSPPEGLEGLDLGIHAVKDYKALIQNILTMKSIYDPFPSIGLWSDYKADVAGEVYLWGEVKECPYGWLAEFAYPKKLWMPEDTDPVVVMQLEENYGVPVELNPDFGDYKQTSWDSIYSMIFNYPAASRMVRPLLKSGKNISFFNYSSAYPSVSVTDGTIPTDTQIEIKTDKEKP